MAALQLQCTNLSLTSRSSQTCNARLPNRRHVICAVQKLDYRPPSSRTAATELDYLEGWSTVVPDTLLLQNIEKIEAPKAATVSSAVLGGILRNPAGLQEYKVAAGLLLMGSWGNLCSHYSAGLSSCDSLQLAQR